MSSGIAVVVYILSLGLLAAYSAALTALGVLSLHGVESSEDSTPDWLVARATDDPVTTGVALGMARSLSILCVVVSAIARESKARPLSEASWKPAGSQNDILRGSRGSSRFRQVL